jgi:hypothetical protein
VTKFRELVVGDTFDFVDTDRLRRVFTTSFYDRCTKVSPRKYRSLRTYAEYEIGSLNCEVFHVKRRKVDVDIAD